VIHTYHVKVLIIIAGVIVECIRVVNN